jgi:hypothetical protein
MTVEEFNQELALLGVHGPMGELKQDGVLVLAYKLFDGSTKFFPPAVSMTPAQRAATIQMLKEHLGLVNSRREAGGSANENEPRQRAYPFGNPNKAKPEP